MRTRMRIAGAAIGLLLAGVVAASASAGLGRPAGLSPQAYRALMLRSQALNVVYGLGRPAGMSEAAYRAMLVQGAALNQRYGLPVAFSADQVARLYGARAGEIATPARSSIPNVSSTSGSGFDWTDAMIGGSFVVGVFVLGAAAAVAVRQHGHMPHAR